MTDSDVTKWNRRGRALGAGIVWVLGVSALVTVSPAAVKSWLQSTESFVIEGVLMAALGLCYVLVDCGLTAASAWSEPENAELLRWDDE